FGGTPGERLRGLADHGFLLRKWETYDARYAQGGYEWGTATGGRGLLVKPPRLVATFDTAAPPGGTAPPSGDATTPRGALPPPRPALLAARASPVDDLVHAGGVLLRPDRGLARQHELLPGGIHALCQHDELQPHRRHRRPPRGRLDRRRRGDARRPARPGALP